MTTTPALPADGPTARPPNQRERILDVALELMSEQGAGSTSMRQLARSCGLNVAAIYHYFPSKADLLRSVIEERQYHVRLRELPAVDTGLPPRELLAGLIEEMWVGAMDEERVWRLLLGEAVHGDETAQAVGRELLDSIETALGDWLATLLPELDDVTTAAEIIVGQLYTAFMERMFLPERGFETVRARARRIASLVLPA